MKIALDLDGVFANFNKAFIALVKEKTGINLPCEGPDYPTTWNYHLDGGVTLAQAEELFVKHIGESHNFWMRLDTYPEGERILKALALQETSHDLYFITDRIGKSAKFQTEAWLLKWFTLPTVLVARDKGAIIKALGVELYIDDKPENVNAAVDATAGKTVVLMPERPYNRNVIVDARVQRVKNLEKVLGQMLGFGENVPLGRLVA